MIRACPMTKNGSPAIALCLAAALLCIESRPAGVAVPADPIPLQYQLGKVKIADTDVIEEIDADSRAQTLVREIRSLPLVFVSNVGPGFVWIIATDDEWASLRKQGFGLKPILRGDELTLHRRMVWGPEMTLPAGYHTYEEIVAELAAIHRAYPETTSLEVIGETQEFRKKIRAIRVSGRPAGSGDVPRVFVSAAIHGHEVMGTEVAMEILREILARSRAGEEPFARYVSDLEIWFVPVINVDGYTIATTIHPNWRKNARDNDGDGRWTVSDGVDLNRNFDYRFDAGGSGDPASRYYRGPYAFSERETRDLAAFVRRQKFLFSISYHSAESRVYYPWRETVDGREVFTPEDGWLTELAREVAGRIRCINRAYTYEAVRNTANECYTTNYDYAELGTIDFMIELGKYDHVYPEAVLRRIVADNLPGVFHLLGRALGPGLTGLVADESSGRALSAEVRILPFDRDDDEIKPRTTDPVTGRFFRALPPGTYVVEVEAEGFSGRRFENVVVAEGGWTRLDCRLSGLAPGRPVLGFLLQPSVSR
jgi:hypothetical protein